LDSVHTDVDPNEPQACVHDGILEGFGYAGDAEEVRGISDKEPYTRGSLASNHPIAEKGAAEVVA
jgi:hypothetical protein